MGQEETFSGCGACSLRAPDVILSFKLRQDVPESCDLVQRGPTAGKY
jgi:hypothetical protein